jgi:hypothetical protein
VGHVKVRVSVDVAYPPEDTLTLEGLNLAVTPEGVDADNVTVPEKLASKEELLGIEY